MTGRAGPERRGPERPGPDYPPEWDHEPDEAELLAELDELGVLDAMLDEDSSDA
jgi:hypothetical protein